MTISIILRRKVHYGKSEKNSHKKLFLFSHKYLCVCMYVHVCVRAYVYVVCTHQSQKMTFNPLVLELRVVRISRTAWVII